MKSTLMIPALALTLPLALAGCAAPGPQGGDKKLADHEERYIPTGTLFSKKDPKRTDPTKMVDKESFEQMIQQNAGSNNPFSKM